MILEVANFSIDIEETKKGSLDKFVKKVVDCEIDNRAQLIHYLTEYGLKIKSIKEL